MKKMISVCLALVLALGLTGICLAESENARPAPSPDPYSGIWQCDRASIEIDWEEDGYRVFIEWSNSAWEHTEWQYSCFYHEEDNTLVSMPFGLRTDVVYTEDSDEPSYTDIYDDGQATFFLDEDGHLIWQDEKEDAGKDMHFERIGD